MPHNEVRISLVSGNMIMQTCDDGFGIIFGLAVCLRVICSGSDVFHTKEGASSLKNYGHELQTVVREDNAQIPNGMIR